MFNTGAVAKKLKENEYDLIMDTFDTEKWVEKIKSVLHNENYFETLKNNLSLYYNKLFSEQNYVTTCLNIYQNILRS